MSVYYSVSQTPSPARRVVVTGMGIVSAFGVGCRVNAEGFRAGRTAFRPVTLFDVSRQRVQQAGQMELPPDEPSTRLSPGQVRRLDRATRILLWATMEAWNQAGWDPMETLPMVLGTTSGGMSQGEAYYRQAIASPYGQRGQPTRVLQYLVHTQAGQVAAALGCAGPLTVISNACASGANALGHAWQCLCSGQAECILAGGYDALSQLVFAGFDALQTLSPTRCRPFDLHRDGLLLGEGAGVLALETLDHARQRRAEILAELVGYGAASDPHHLTQPEPQGTAICRAMTNACQAAGIPPEQIGYLNAHGTGTPLNDTAEALAINRWAGTHVKSIPVSSSKGGIGHLLGAAGAVESLVCLMALREGWLPPTASLVTPDPVCLFPLVQRPTEADLRYALTNSCGFGGANASLIFKRWE